MNYVSQVRDIMKIKEHPKDPAELKSGIMGGANSAMKLAKLMSGKTQDKLTSLSSGFVKEVNDAGYTLSGKDIKESAKALLIFGSLRGTNSIFVNSTDLITIDDDRKDIYLDKEQLKVFFSDWVYDQTGMDVDGLIDKDRKSTR